jgi:hypothetical protein
MRSRPAGGEGFGFFGFESLLHAWETFGIAKITHQPSVREIGSLVRIVNGSAVPQHHGACGTRGLHQGTFVFVHHGFFIFRSESKPGVSRFIRPPVSKKLFENQMRSLVEPVLRRVLAASVESDVALNVSQSQISGVLIHVGPAALTPVRSSRELDVHPVQRTGQARASVQSGMDGQHVRMLSKFPERQGVVNPITMHDPVRMRWKFRRFHGFVIQILLQPDVFQKIPNHVFKLQTFFFGEQRRNDSISLVAKSLTDMFTMASLPKGMRVGTSVSSGAVACMSSGII